MARKEGSSLGIIDAASRAGEARRNLKALAALPLFRIPHRTTPKQHWMRLKRQVPRSTPEVMPRSSPRARGR